MKNLSKPVSIDANILAVGIYGGTLVAALGLAVITIWGNRILGWTLLFGGTFIALLACFVSPIYRKISIQQRQFKKNIYNWVESNYNYKLNNKQINILSHNVKTFRPAWDRPSSLFESYLVRLPVNENNKLDYLGKKILLGLVILPNGEAYLRPYDEKKHVEKVF